MLANQLSLLTFTSKIKFVSDEEFHHRTVNQPRNWSNRLYIGDPWDDAVAGPHGLTEDIYGCNAGGLTNTISRDGVVFHFKPAAAKYTEEQFQNKILNALKDLGQYTNRLGGLIIGGKTAASGDMNHSNSQLLSEKLEVLFNQLSASITKFWGQKTPGAHTNIFYSGEEDTWYINYQDDNKRYNSHQIQTPEDIKDAYFNIEVSDYDQVYIDENEIDKFELKPEFKKIDGGYELDLLPRNPFYQPQYDYSDQSWKERSKVKLYLANYGQDPKTLWVETQNQANIPQVIERINDIKEAGLFNQIEKVQYKGLEAVEGFEPFEPLGDKIVFEYLL